MSLIDPPDVALLFRKYGVPTWARTEGLTRALQSVGESSAFDIEAVVQELAVAVRRYEEQRPEHFHRRAVHTLTKWLDMN